MSCRRAFSGALRGLSTVPLTWLGLSLTLVSAHCSDGENVPAAADGAVVPDGLRDWGYGGESEAMTGDGVGLEALPLVCQGGIVKCQDASVMECAADGSGWLLKEACPEGALCIDNACCIPYCSGRECGDDGCGGVCGWCSGAQVSCREGRCRCQPQCVGKVCGADGCGGECGACLSAQEECVAGQCVCLPACVGKECGPDGCDGLCGQCHGDLQCVEGLCTCIAQCEGKECGPDGCGAQCGDCPGPQASCSEGGLCVCVPACEAKECGPDGCGDECGLCPGPQDACLEGQCLCQPACLGKGCGPDGCGGSCGACSSVQESCLAGQCICAPYCVGKECGSDGCGGQCGLCDDGLPCTADACLDGACSSALAEGCLIGGFCFAFQQDDPTNPCQWCEPLLLTYAFSKKAEGTACGTNAACKNGKCKCSFEACGADCCEEGEVCYKGTCCQPDCGGEACGDDGCGGSCGLCDDGLWCSEDLCVEGTCVHLVEGAMCLIGGQCVQSGVPKPGAPCRICQPGKSQSNWSELPDGSLCASGKICSGGECCDHVSHCLSKECGSDGCGWSCGTCPPGTLCTAGLCVCSPSCDFKECGSDGCGGSCGKCAAGFLCSNGTCVLPPCQPTCEDGDKECGDDGCGGVCGNCSDGLTCTKDVCAQGQCQYQAGASYCVLNSSCVSQGQLDPDSVCRKCQPGLSQEEWTPIPDGVACGQGKFCFQGLCCDHAAHCSGKECGSDGCGGLCGACAPGLKCLDGFCE